MPFLFTLAADAAPAANDEGALSLDEALRKQKKDHPVEHTLPGITQRVAPPSAPDAPESPMDAQLPVAAAILAALFLLLFTYAGYRLRTPFVRLLRRLGWGDPL